MDIAKLRINLPPGIPGAMLILTTYPKESGGGFDFLAGELEIALGDMVIGRFDNSNGDSVAYEFAVVGFLVHKDK